MLLDIFYQIKLQTGWPELLSQVCLSAGRQAQVRPSGSWCQTSYSRPSPTEVVRLVFVGNYCMSAKLESCILAD